MSWPLTTIGPDETVRHAARLMYARKLRRLPVVDQQGRLAGIVTRADLLSAFTRPDDELRRQITQDVIADGFFTDPDRLTVTVKDGIVTLAGAPGSVILGRNIAGEARPRAAPLRMLARDGAETPFRWLARAEVTRAGDFTQLRRHLRRFEALTSAIWEIQASSG